MFYFRRTLWLLLLMIAPLQADDKIDFDKQIRPILQRRCLSCHGREKQEGGLRLDLRRRAIQGGDTGEAIVAGEPEKSRLLQLIAESKAGERMPPEGNKLTDAEVKLFRDWIQQGANWPRDNEDPTLKHWAFQPVTPKPVPHVVDRRWIREPIDAFILNHLEQKNVKPSAEADRATLIRRLHLDLHGLPPSPQAWARWMNKKRSDWYPQLVEELLASPHFGERWGRVWLDLARYADSDGYEKDRPRPNAYHWRDWVLDAINRDLPFDQFTVQQLAGDLLPGATERTRLATGFHRNTLTNREGGIDKEEDRVKQTVDRINTVGTVWLGLTVKCAQCHTHKYDPITQREYYQLYAFFNNSDESDFALQPTADQASAHQQALTKHQSKLKQKTETLNKERDKIRNSLTKIIKDYLKNHPGGVPQPSGSDLAFYAPLDGSLQGGKGTDKAKWHGSAKPEFRPGKKGQSVHFKGKEQITYGEAVRFERDRPFTIAAWLHFEGGGGGIVTKMDENQDFKGLDFTSHEGTLEVHLVQKWPSNAIKVTTNNRIKKNTWQHVTVTYDGTGKAAGVKIYIDSILQPLKTHFDQLTGSFNINEPLRVGSRKRTSYFKGNIDEVRIYNSVLSIDQIKVLAGDDGLRKFLELAQLESAKRSKKQTEEMVEYLIGRQKPLSNLRAEIEQLTKNQPKVQRGTGMVLAQAKKPRQTFVHIRGEFLNKGAQVDFGVPSFLPKMSRRGTSPDRLDLARWIVDKSNPLTARVAVNRVWQHYFEQGLVATSDDFGTQGDQQTHPELLDWLAAELVNSGWQMKALHRRIVNSATYRQSSAARPDLAERDPGNQWLARQNRVRVAAETVRDLSLVTSGLLDRRTHGPSVRPPLPPGILELAFVDVINRGPWKTSTGGDKYRRGVYTFYQRTSPFPMLTLFDAPDSTVACTRRQTSNTPLQALTLWNDPSMLESARTFAVRVMRAKRSDADRLREAFLVAVSRPPTEEDLRDLRQFLDISRKVYQSQPKLRDQFLGKFPIPAEWDRTEFAAWTSVTRTLMNLDEFITRE